MYEFTVRHCDWYKRRVRTNKPKEISRFVVENFVAQHNAYCIVHMWYDDEPDVHELTGRVTQNTVTGKFSVNGINPHGDFILLDVIEV